MSTSTAVQLLCWGAVVWLFTVQVMTARGMLVGDGRATRVAGVAAATSVLAAALVTRFWPVAALALLWLRTELFTKPALIPAPHLTAPHLPRVTVPHIPHPHLSGLHVPHPHLHAPEGERPHRRHPLVQQALDVILKIEIGVVVLILAALFLNWSMQERHGFNNRSDQTLCGLTKKPC